MFGHWSARTGVATHENAMGLREGGGPFGTEGEQQLSNCLSTDGQRVHPPCLMLCIRLD